MRIVTFPEWELGLHKPPHSALFPTCQEAEKIVGPNGTIEVAVFRRSAGSYQIAIGRAFPTCNSIVSLTLRDARFVKESLKFSDGDNS